MKNIYNLYYETFLSRSQSLLGLLLLLLCTAIAILLSFSLQIIFHELGHLLFGKITGYRFWFLRILDLVLIKEQNKWSLKRYGSYGSLGQCLMLPSKGYQKNIPYALYHLGGIIVNGFTGILSLYFLMNGKFTSYFLCNFIIFLTFFGLGFSILNGLPCRIFGNNDGSNYFALKNDISAQASYYQQIKILHEVFKGSSFGEIPINRLQVPWGCDLTNPIIINQKLIECYHYMEHKKWQKAKEVIKAIIASMEGLNNSLADELRMEVIFLEILLGDFPSVMIKNIPRIMETKKGYQWDADLVRYRVAYEIYHDFNRLTLDEVNKMKETYLLKIDKLEKYHLFLGQVKFLRKMVIALLDKD
jgi:hypothetical protein